MWKGGGERWKRDGRYGGGTGNGLVGFGRFARGMRGGDCHGRLMLRGLVLELGLLLSSGGFGGDSGGGGDRGRSMGFLLVHSGRMRNCWDLELGMRLR